MKTKGFHVVEILLGLAIAIVLAIIGWRVWEAQTASTNNSTHNVAKTAPAEAPMVEQAEDLDEASAVVEELSLDSSDKELSELEKELEAL